jgi:DHA2 family multidrug resistance protein-like MFS transporter
LAVAAAMTMAVLDGTIANTALPTIARELHVSPARSVAVVTAYQLAITMTLFAAASVGAARGLSRTFRYGVILFTVGSLCCSLAPSLPFLVASRVLQGIGGAGLMAISPALLRHIFPRAQLGRAIGVNGMVVGSGLAAGPTIGGAILAVAPWPWLFLVNVPLGIGIWLLARRVLPRDAGHGAIDWPSIVTSAIGFGGIIFGIDGFARGDPPAFALLEMGIGAASFAWFLRRQPQLERPMFAVGLFKRPRFVLAATTSYLSFIAWGLAFVAMPFYFQIELGVTPLISGLLLTPLPLLMGVLAPISGRLSDRYPVAVLSSGGLLIFVAGMICYALLPPHPATAAILACGALCGIGFGIFQPPNNRELMSNTPREQSGSAAAIQAAMRVGGQTSGAAAAAVIFAAIAVPIAVHAGLPAMRGAVTAALCTSVAFGLVACAVSAVRFRL